jgi:hypothetical protein
MSISAPGTLSTFRQDMSAGLAALLAAYRAANAGVIAAHWAARPAQFTETPLTVLGSMDEGIRHDAGTRSRTMVAELVLVDHLADAQETAGRLHPIVDSLLDWLTANPHLGDYVWVAEPVGVIGTDTEPAGGEAGSWHFEIIRVQATAQEGRT